MGFYPNHASPRTSPLLSIAIPAYGRRDELLHCLDRFISQIRDKYENEIEILVSDDHSPQDNLADVRQLAERYSFIRYRRYPENIGLEKNLIACTNGCMGEYLWIFGDDDFLEVGDAIDQIMALLQLGQFEFYVLNRTRRSFDLSRTMSRNWMNLDVAEMKTFSGLREFCLARGFISVIGFISVCIFRRKAFQSVDASKYMGTMYPQLGAMVEAFHDKRTLLVGRPLVCHRTQTPEEKRAALGDKLGESDFMSDVQQRNAIYFSHPYIRMLSELVRLNAFLPEDIVRIPENTVINGLLIDFLLQNVALSKELQAGVSLDTWRTTKGFLDALPLDLGRRHQADALFKKEAEMAVHDLTISVISPSFNQAEFLGECLASVRDQTYKPIEHFVYDPGSKDDSRAIARTFPHVTLVAEPDAGQSDALNKGFQRASGDIIAWLNSDDCLANAGVFKRVVQRFLEPDAPDIVYGIGIYVDESGKKLRDVYINKDPSLLAWRFQHEDGILQPALFMRRSVIQRVGLLRKDLHFCMDYEYWIRCVKAGMKFAFINEQFAIARYHSNNKTYGMRGKSYSEVCDMLKEHFGYVNHIWLKRYAEFLTEGHDGVLANSGNVGIKDQFRLDAIYRELLSAYNTSQDTYRLLVERAGERGYGDTLREMKSFGVEPPVPCKLIPIEQAQEPGCVPYTVGPRRWAFDHKWKDAQVSKAHDFLRERIAERRNDTCVIVGNGPSLNKTNLALLKGQDVIVSNNVFLSEELLKYATYYTVVNYLVAEQSCQHINSLRQVHKVLPYWMAYCLNPGPNTYFVDAVGRAEFSKDIFKNMSWRHTVTFFNLHLAYGLGYRRVVMIGFDHNYKQPQGVIEQEIIQSFEDDDNHFHPGYFRGKKWQAADVHMMEEMYSLAKVAYEEDGREILNSTVGGCLELFPRMPLESALGVKEKPTRRHSLQNVSPAEIELPGPFSRSDSAHLDETDVIAHLFQESRAGTTMIDVGAHHGWSLMQFLNMGWKVLAFEPDEKNRQKLIERLAKHGNSTLVKLDPRAVSNESKKGLSFYRSEVSAGISGLSAFHPSHKAEQIVDTVTLTEALAGEKLEAVDFLKIDTEGHDLFVLKGFPWERFHPAVIECEFEDTKTVPLGYTFHDLATYLVEKGYTVYVSEWHPIVRYGISHDWHRLLRYPCDLADPKGWGNLLAFRDPIDEAALIAAVRQVMKVGGKSASGKLPAAVATASSIASLAANPLSHPHAPVSSSASASLSKSAVSSLAIGRPKPTFASRLSIDLGQPIEGTNWSDPVRVNGTSARRVASGQRATMALSLKRDHALLLLLMLPPRSSREQYDGVRLEIDGTGVSHTLHLDIDPPYLVASVPVRQVAQSHITELAFLVPSRTEPQGHTDGRDIGFAVAKVSVFPAFPKNQAGALTIGKPWSQRLASRLNKEPLAFPFSHFDGLAYVAANPDVAEAILGGRMSSGLRHYQKYGRSEGRACAIAFQRIPSIGGLGEIFDGQAYLETYPDIAEAIRSGMRSSALEHYVEYGRKEGRRARLRLDGAARRGTASDLVELETLRTTTAITDAIRDSISKEVAKQVGQLKSELTRVTSVFQTKLDQLTKEQSAQQAAQATQTAANLAGTADELRAELARVTKEQSAQQAAQTAQVAANLARMAGELRAELARVTKEQSAQQAAQAAKVAADLARTSEELRGELARVAKEQIAQFVAACVENGNGGGSRKQLVGE